VPHGGIVVGSRRLYDTAAARLVVGRAPRRRGRDLPLPPHVCGVSHAGDPHPVGGQ